MTPWEEPQGMRQGHNQVLEGCEWGPNRHQVFRIATTKRRTPHLKYCCICHGQHTPSAAPHINFHTITTNQQTQCVKILLHTPQPTSSPYKRRPAHKLPHNDDNTVDTAPENSDAGGVYAKKKPPLPSSLLPSLLLPSLLPSPPSQSRSSVSNRGTNLSLVLPSRQVGMACVCV